MELHGTVWYFLAIAGIALGFIAVATWAVRSIITSEVMKRYELFRKQLQLEVSQTIEQFRKSMAEEKLIFGTMMDSRSDSLVQLYGMMIDIGKNGRELSKHGLDNLAFVIELAQMAVASIQEFFDSYQKNAIYFSDEFCTAMDSFQTNHEKTLVDLTAAIHTKTATPQNESQVIADIQKNWSAFENDIPQTIIEMKREFRSLVGSAGKWW